MEVAVVAAVADWGQKWQPTACLMIITFDLLFFWSGSLVARIHLMRWISGVSGVRTPAPAYNNALSYQLSYAI